MALTDEEVRRRSLISAGDTHWLARPRGGVVPTRFPLFVRWLIQTVTGILIWIWELIGYRWRIGWTNAAVRSFGLNSFGQLGDNSISTGFHVLVANLGSTHIKSVHAGGTHSLALDRDGRVWGWGRNGSAQLGDGTYSNQRLLPVQVHLPEGEVIVAIAAGGDHSFAITATQKAYAWGLNNHAQLGDHYRMRPFDPNHPDEPLTATHLSTKVPVPVLMTNELTSVKLIAGGALHSVALDTNGRVFTWGSNEEGQHGRAPEVQNDGGSITVLAADATEPKRVFFQDDPAIVAIAAGGMSSLALDVNGAVWIWGGRSTESWSGDNPYQFAPQRIPGVTGATAIATSGKRSLVLDGTGAVWEVTYDGATGPLAAQVQGIPAAIRAVAAGGNSAYVLDPDGYVWGWGDNDFGQIQRRTQFNRIIATPLRVEELEGVSFGGRETWE